MNDDVTYHRLNTTLKRLKGYKNSDVSAQIIEVLFHNCKDSRSTILARSPPLNILPWTPFSKVLNESQTKAIHASLGAREICAIHGPPGTGKTTTVVEFIRQCVALGLKVLATAPSNIAVDNMVGYHPTLQLTSIFNLIIIEPILCGSCSCSCSCSCAYLYFIFRWNVYPCLSGRVNQI